MANPKGGSKRVAPLPPVTPPPRAVKLPAAREEEALGQESRDIGKSYVSLAVVIGGGLTLFGAVAWYQVYKVDKLADEARALHVQLAELKVTTTNVETLLKDVKTNTETMRESLLRLQAQDEAAKKTKDEPAKKATP
jgi:outer membrane murein-binding lipoprotein Lpp